MLDYTKVLTDGTYFTCDKYGKGYAFSGSYGIVIAGQEYNTPLTNGETIRSDKDLCRDCSGMTEKLFGKDGFYPNCESMLQAEIIAIDAATENLKR